MNTAAILDAATGREALNLAKELKQIRNTIASMTGRAALSAAKRIREIREALGVGNTADNKPNPATMEDVIAAMPLLKKFIGKSQLAVMGAGVRGEEGQYFKDKFVEVAEVIKNMPHTYQTDGQGDKAVAYLHYFKGGMDWYITEKDKGDDESTDQIQAFGYADLGQGGGEVGYISIQEIIGAGVELDLHWTPKTLGQIKNGGDSSSDGNTESGQVIDENDAEFNRYAEMESNQVMELSQADFERGLDVFQEYNEHTEYVVFAAKRTGNNELISEANQLLEEHNALPDGVTMEFTNRRFELQKRINAELEKMNSKGDPVPEESNQKSGFIDELELLKAETDINRFNERLDDIASRIEQAGLMDALDAELNSAADKLTELLAEAEK